VATRFIHINFIPVIPLGSCIIVTGNSKAKDFQGTKTALSVKSILVAWFRAGLLALALCTTVIGFVVTTEFFENKAATPPLALAVVWGIVVGICAILWMTYRFNRASYDRAMQLGTELGLEAEFIEQLLMATRPEPTPGKEPAKEPEGWERYS
jgi:hypothetical protein